MSVRFSMRQIFVEVDPRTGKQVTPWTAVGMRRGRDSFGGEEIREPRGVKFGALESNLFIYTASEIIKYDNLRRIAVQTCVVCFEMCLC